MADISGRFLQLKAISPLLVGQNWETRIAADSTGALFTSIKGAAYTPIGGFGSNTIVQLPNIAGTPVNALQLQASLTNNGVGTEASQWVIRLLKGGAQAPGGGFGVDTYTLGPDTMTLNSVTAKLSLFSDVQIYRDATFGNMNFDSNGGDVVIDSAAGALLTTTTTGFLQITQCAGTPSGVPSKQRANHTPMIYDTTANKIWFYNGSWRGVLVA